MSQIEDARKALIEAARVPFIQVEVQPEAVMVNDPIHITARFFSRSLDDLLNLTPIDVLGKPVVEMIGELSPGEEPITYLQRKSIGVYECELIPTSRGTHTYKVKEREETDIGELVEVEVLDKRADELLKEFFDKLMSGQLEEFFDKFMSRKP